jgi:hypothetical protein
MARSVLNPVVVMRWSSPWGPLPVLVRNGRIRAIALDPRTPLPELFLSNDTRASGPIRSQRDLAHLMRSVLRG